jgi:hypothetical protein
MLNKILFDFKHTLMIEQLMSHRHHLHVEGLPKIENYNGQTCLFADLHHIY